MTDADSPSAPSPKISYPEWQADYQAALLELNHQELPKRVEAAETKSSNASGFGTQLEQSC
jgi:hypothetical protein